MFFYLERKGLRITNIKNLEGTRRGLNKTLLIYEGGKVSLCFLQILRFLDLTLTSPVVQTLLRKNQLEMLKIVSARQNRQKFSYNLV